MKVHSLHQVSQSLGFERGESRITNPPEHEKTKTRWACYQIALVSTHRKHLLLFTFTQLYSRVGIEISIVDCFNQLLRNLDDLLFTSCRQNKRQKEANRWQLVRCQLEGETITVWWVSAQWHFVSSLQLLPSFTRSSSAATARVPSFTWSPGSKSCLVTGAQPPSLSLAQLLAFATTQQLTEHDSPPWAHTANQTEATTLLVEITAFLTRGPLSFLLLWPTVRCTSEQTCQTLTVLFTQLFLELINSNSLINFNPFPLQVSLYGLS